MSHITRLKTNMPAGWLGRRKRRGARFKGVISIMSRIAILVPIFICAWSNQALALVPICDASVEPTLRKPARIALPTGGWRGPEKGWVEVGYTVNSNGEVSGAFVISSSSKYFERWALKTASQTQYGRVSKTCQKSEKIRIDMNL